MQNRTQVEQAIYEAILGTAEQTSQALVEIAHNIQAAIETSRKLAYKMNEDLMSLSAQNALTSEHTQDNTATKRMAETVGKITEELSQTNQDILALQETVKLTHGIGPVDPAVKAAYDNRLKDLNELNSKYLALNQQLTLLNGEYNNASPQQKTALEGKLGPIYTEAKALKDSAKLQVQKAQVVEKKADEKPQGPRFG